MSEYLVILTVALAGAGLVAASVLVRRALAPVDPVPAKYLTYESGVDPVGSAEQWSQGSVRYFAFALVYVIFAVDVVYLFPWALVLRTELGLASLVEMTIFVGIILLGVAHAWRRGLLRWL